MRYQPLLAKIALGGFGLGLGIALAATSGTRLGLWSYGRGVEILVPGVAVGAVGLICGVAWIARALIANDSTGWRAGMIGLIGSALVVGIPARYLWLAYSLPPIHDISTDIGEAPDFETLLAWRHGAPNPASYDGPNIVTYGGERMTTALAQKYSYADVRPLYRLDSKIPQKQYESKFFWRALNTANALGWRVASFDLKSGRIEATDASFWFGVVSDIVIRIRPAGTIGVRIDIRAKSRTGTSDMGRNAAIARSFLVKMKGG